MILKKSDKIPELKDLLKRANVKIPELAEFTGYSTHHVRWVLLEGYRGSERFWKVLESGWQKYLLAQEERYKEISLAITDLLG